MPDTLPREELIRKAEHRDVMARLIDLAEVALRDWSVVVSDFYAPPEVGEALAIFERLVELHAVAWGGYPQAERQRIALARESIAVEADQIPVAAIDIRGNFLFDAASHRDFLGALLGTGIVRAKVGDILVLGDRGAQALVVPELVPFLEMQLKSVRTVSVQVVPVDRSELRVRPPQTKEITSVEASLRIDALGSAGFGLSRNKMVEAIEAGDVTLNWKTVTQPSKNVQTGDRIALRGRGRLEIGEVEPTKKGRFRVQMLRYQ
ncbi:photosystem II S4 domain protein [Gloeobacter kilaueensis]|uniref:RNA-binding S4 domain protein n=1 Tax=Gloeobacter kilaueensis (strain ATCC BAA-2537 / CCAP 1431/1 / ULC 316 / JS1) TaxID=1183438 RepID=U5QGR2_GLOK1|nr:photosystem II S4 domain protein [Gloeobacter kilaueensis]AGY58136.1 RNA-binding S4 domain protein [Gloeobacter kilaueensis JS1]